MASAPPPKKLKITEDQRSMTRASIFNGLHVYIVEQGVGKVRCNILKRQVENHGGCVVKEVTSQTTHIIVNNGLKKEKLFKLIKKRELGSNVKVLTADWLSSCLVRGDVVEDNGYEACLDAQVVCEAVETQGNDVEKKREVKDDKDENNPHQHCADTNEMKAKGDLPGTSCHDSGREEHSGGKCEAATSGGDEDIAVTSKEKSFNSKAFVCARPSTSAGENFNSNITSKLQVLLEEYTSTQDRWRAFGYKKAIASISKYHKPLETYEEVLNLPSVGERLAKKVWEIIETGHLQRLDHIDPKVEKIKMFSGVWGAGPKTAEQWVARGFKCLKDLPVSELTFQQKIGVEHYNDINAKMPRSEAAEIEKLIRRHAETLLPGVLLVVCGSYRRGRDFCGDIDLLISHPDGESHEGLLFSLLNKLKEVKLVTDDLITVENEAQKKYMGLCRLPVEGSKFRRIDFILAPYKEWHCALLHFTGSAHFNRSIRLLAKKKNMSLSEHALRKDVVRGQTGEKVNKGQIVPVSSEADVFKYLGLDFLEPTERDW